MAGASRLSCRYLTNKSKCVFELKSSEKKSDSFAFVTNCFERDALRRT